MRYVTPGIIDYGSIADHTFTNAGGTCTTGTVPPKNVQPRCRDNFCEYSHTTGVDQCGDDPNCTGPNPGGSTCP